MRQLVCWHQSDALLSVRHIPMKLKSITLPLKSGSASSASVISDSLHNCDGLFEITGMNPYAKQMTPVVTGIFQDTNCVSEIIALIDKHMLRPQ